ncbi:Uma2 family endonuclease [Synechococcus sp. CS-1332]|uniref:Uma2 family endonuclease n=1 Tax=Synechococcus sp. CS-1332 TaxID=2847972 RepID=UPI00288010B9|nr:Uma2 family endonuclease [Synechococcus sp. CS-1332]
MLSPDASLVRLERWQALTAEERLSFPPFCPDLLVELANPGDEGPRGLTALRRKMAAYHANGAQLGWLLIPEQQAFEIWSSVADGEPQRLQGAMTLEGGERFPGLSLELTEIWEA